MTRENESAFQHARGNLSFLDFIRLVSKLWVDGHPGIPILATGSKEIATYPAILYRIDLRTAITNEPKPKLREEIRTPEGTAAVVVYGQRFQTVVSFTAITQNDPNDVEAVIEEFEDFMVEMQPVFKELGVSELVYLRRLPDAHDSRPGIGTTERTVSYLLTTERIRLIEVDKLNQIGIDARIAIGPKNVYFETNPTDDTIIVYGATFSIGDRVLIHGRMGIPMPVQLRAGYYFITNIIQSGTNTEYTLARYWDGQYVPINPLGGGAGYLSAAPDPSITSGFTDQFFSQATPNF